MITRNSGKNSSFLANKEKERETGEEGGRDESEKVGHILVFWEKGKINLDKIAYIAKQSGRFGCQQQNEAAK